MIVKIGDYELDIKGTASFAGQKLSFNEDEAAGHFLNEVSIALGALEEAIKLKSDIHDGLKEAGFYDRKSE